MYTTTQLLLLLAALSGAGTHVSSVAQSRNAITTTVTKSVHATVNVTPSTAVDGKSASLASISHQGRETPMDGR
jgi:hypothetical protein